MATDQNQHSEREPVITLRSAAEHLSSRLTLEPNPVELENAADLLLDLVEQLEVLREFYDAWWAHENGIVDFDLHHSQVERLRAAANAAFRLTHPPDSGSAVAPAEGSRDQASGSPTPNPAKERDA